MTPLSSILRCAGMISIVTLLGCGEVPDPELALNEATGADEAGAEIPECALLTDAEITAAIGPHEVPEQDYQFGGCLWLGPPGDIPGFRPGIIVAVVDAGVFEQVAEIGEPMPELGDGATYSELYGELWFPCRGDSHCGLKVNISDPDQREAVARRLGRLLRDRT